MSVETDLELNKQADTLATSAMQWLSQNKTLLAMDQSSENIRQYDCPDYKIYVQETHGPKVKFGHLIMREGIPRGANAAIIDLGTIGGTGWALCAINDHPASTSSELAQHVINSTLVHEATHYLDFVRTHHKPVSYKDADANDLRRKYYTKPHEFNAFYHEGLYCFLRDIGSIVIQQQVGSPIALRHLTNDAYWPLHFVNGLTPRYWRKLIRRYARTYLHLLAADKNRAGARLS